MAESNRAQTLVGQTMMSLLRRRNVVNGSIVRDIGHMPTEKVVNIVLSYVSVVEAERIAREISKGWS